MAWFLFILSQFKAIHHHLKNDTMKKSILFPIFIWSSFFYTPVFSQNNQNYASTGLAGDNFNLYGVLDMFQESETLEGFEQKLNAEDSKVNNLDLDGNGKIDYIKVIDHVNGSAHTIVLQDVINENESQDVAVIEVDRDRNNQVVIQIIGDEQLYGKDYIIEPASGTPNPGYSGNNNVNSNGNTTVVNNNYYNNDRGYAYRHAASWGIIRFIFAPSYVVYVSPWRWSYYPSYWHPWHQMHYYDYHNHWSNHRSQSYFHQAHTYNVPTAHNYYGPRRTSSGVVRQKNDRGEYKRTNIDSKRNSNIQLPENKVRKNTTQDQRENRKSVIENNPASKRATLQINYSKPNPTESRDRKPATGINERKAEKSNTRQEIRQNSRQEVKQNTNPVVKQNTRTESRQEKTKDTKRR